MQIKTPLLYGITDSSFMSGRILLNKVEAALKGGASWIQYRDKSDDAKKRLREATQLLELCKQYRGLLIINDDVALAKKIAAHGVHLGQDDTPIRHAREYLGEDFLIGATCHDSLEMAIAAQRQGASYLAFGRFFPSRTKGDARPAELTVLTAARQLGKLPLVAIGGIDTSNAKTVARHGADALAVCRALFDCDDVELRAKKFLNP